MIRAEPIPIEKHFSPRFYAELWGVDVSTVVRWFRDTPGVLKVGNPRGAGRSRCELRIPLSIAMKVYSERTR